MQWKKKKVLRFCKYTFMMSSLYRFYWFIFIICLSLRQPGNLSVPSEPIPIFCWRPRTVPSDQTQLEVGHQEGKQCLHCFQRKCKWVSGTQATGPSTLIFHPLISPFSKKLHYSYAHFMRDNQESDLTASLEVYKRHVWIYIQHVCDPCRCANLPQDHRRSSSAH